MEDYQVTDVKQRTVLGVGFGLMFLIECGQFFTRNGRLPGSIALICGVLALAAFFAVRGALTATVIAHDRGVTVRGFLRTHKLPWSQVDGFVAETRPFGLARYPRRVLGIRRGDGGILWSSVNCKPASVGRTWLDQERDVLNQYLNAQRRHAAEALAQETGTRPGADAE